MVFPVNNQGMKNTDDDKRAQADYDAVKIHAPSGGGPCPVLRVCKVEFCRSQRQNSRF
jgi:hypothetical protein